MTTKESYDKGFIDALDAFAVWRDGVQHVGTMMIPLDEIKKDPSRIYSYCPPTSSELDPSDDCEQEWS